MVASPAPLVWPVAIASFTLSFTPTLNRQGLQVSERYVQQILDEFLAARRGNGRAGARKPKR